MKIVITAASPQRVALGHRILALLSLSLAVAVSAGASSPGVLDPTFDLDGKLTTSFGGYQAISQAVAVQSDGKIVVGGVSYTTINTGDFALTRYNPDGSLDITFGTGGKATTSFGLKVATIWALAIYKSGPHMGKIVAAGDTTASGLNVFALARYNTDGTLDPTFGGGTGKVTTGFALSGDINVTSQALSVAIQSDDRIVLAGNTVKGFSGAQDSPANNGFNFAVARYDANGTLDTSFGGTGKVITDIGGFSFGGGDGAYAVAIQSDGKIVAAGNGNPLASGNADFAVVRYNIDGTLDPAFGVGGKVTTDFGSVEDYAKSVGIQSDGRIVVTGSFGSYPWADFALARYNPNGTLDTTFDVDGKVTTNFGGWDLGQAMAIQSDGGIVAAGHTQSSSYALDFAVARYNANGSLDTTFAGTGKVTADFGGGPDAGHAVAIQSDGKIVVAGSGGVATVFAVARFGGTVPPSAVGQTINFAVLASRTFGDAPFALNATATSGLPVTFSIVSGPAIVSGNTVTITGAGSAIVRASQAGNVSYTPAPNVDRTLTVAKAVLIATAANATRIYGAANPAFTISYSGFVNGNTAAVIDTAPVASTSADETSNVGSYAINVSGGADDSYTFSYVAGTLVIAPAAQTISFGAIPGVTFGNPPFALSASASSGLPVAFSIVSGPATLAGNTVTLTGAGNTVTLTGAGTVTVRALQPGSANYNSAPNVDRSFTVAKATLVVTASDATRVYGTPNPAFSVTYNGFVNGNTAAVLDTAPVALSLADASSNVGAYPITAGGGFDDSYAFSYVAGSLQITAAGQSITFAPLASRTFGDAPFALSATATSGAPVTFTVVSGPATVSGNLVTLTGAGPVTIRATEPGNANFLAATPVDQSFTIAKATATITLASLVHAYDGTPKSATATTSPAELTVTITYNGSATPPTLPGTYIVVATVNDSGYSASATGTLTITTTALVRHAPDLNGAIDGSLQILTAENIALTGNAWVSGDILVPGMPTVRLNGHPTFVGTQDGTGSATPSNYQVTLNGNALVRYLVRRTDPIAMPVVNAPPAPTGTRNVTLNSASDSAGSFATLRNLTLNGSAGAVAVPPGTYGTFITNGNSRFVLGVAGASTPAVYNFQALTLNGKTQLQIVGPVSIRLATGATFGGNIGSAGHPEWLTLLIASGGVTLNGNVTFSGSVVAPSGTVTLNGNGQLNGTVACDRLTLSGDAMLRQ